MPLMRLKLAFVLMMTVASTAVSGGPVDPDCNATKAAKSAAAKATVGVGGRCSAGEAVKDQTKDAVGIEDKGPMDKRRNDDGIAKKTTKKIID